MKCDLRWDCLSCPTSEGYFKRELEWLNIAIVQCRFVLFWTIRRLFFWKQRIKKVTNPKILFRMSSLEQRHGFFKDRDIEELNRDIMWFFPQDPISLSLQRAEGRMQGWGNLWSLWQLGAKDVYLVFARDLEEPCGLDVGYTDRQIKAKMETTGDEREVDR